MHPFDSGTTFPLSSSWINPPSEINFASIFTSPMSFTITATLYPSWFVKIWFIRVVLPAPKYPVSIVIGTNFKFSIFTPSKFLFGTEKKKNLIFFY